MSSITRAPAVATKSQRRMLGQPRWAINRFQHAQAIRSPTSGPYTRSVSRSNGKIASATRDNRRPGTDCNPLSQSRRRFVASRGQSDHRRPGSFFFSAITVAEISPRPPTPTHTPHQPATARSAYGKSCLKSQPPSRSSVASKVPSQFLIHPPSHCLATCESMASRRQLHFSPARNQVSRLERRPSNTSGPVIAQHISTARGVRSVGA